MDCVGAGAGLDTVILIVFFVLHVVYDVCTTGFGMGPNFGAIPPRLEVYYDLRKSLVV